MTSDSILVAWNPPAKTNGVILKYHVYIEHPNKVRESLYSMKNELIVKFYTNFLIAESS